MRYLKDLKKIVEINSYTKNKIGVDRIGAVFKEWLLPLGFEIEVFKRELIGDHLLFKSKDTSKDKILLLGHLDTVFAPNTFEDFKEDDRWVYGPGVCDMKGGLIVAYEALGSVYKKFGKISNIDFLMVSDEETGSDDSKFITQKIAKNYQYCFVFEAAGKNLEVVTARKGVGTFKLKIEGKAAHAGVRYKEGINANLEAAHKLIELTKLTNLDIQTTLNVGKITGGIGANTISPHCELLFEIRYTKDSERDRLLSSMKEITNHSFVKGTKSTLSGLIQRDVMQENKEQKKLINLMQKIIQNKILTEHRGGVSDANHTASQGVITLDGLGPFGDGDHTPNERALKSSFEQRIDMMSKVLGYFQKKAK